MVAQVNRLSFKLIVFVSGFLLVLTLTILLTLVLGVRRTQQAATDQSVAGLESQGQESLAAITQREAQLSSAELHRAVMVGEHAAAYFAAMVDMAATVPSTTARELRRRPTGQYFDPSPARRSDIHLPNLVDTIDANIEADIRASAVLDTLAPSLLKQNPDIVAIYYISQHQFARYYPPIGVSDITPPDFDLTSGPFYTLAVPAANPRRATVWTPPYADPAGQGILVTASTPLYIGDVFRGVIGVDVSLARLAERLNTLKATPGGYAFLVDGNGAIVAAPPVALQRLIGPSAGASPTITDTLTISLKETPNSDLLRAVDAMSQGKSGVTQLSLDGQAVFLAYAPLPALGWSLGLVAPIDEVTDEANAVVAAIRTGTETTFESILIVLSIIFLLAVTGTILLSRQLTRPITALVAGTQAVASGAQDVTIPISTRDELGVLAQSFNHMTATIRRQTQELQTQILHAQNAHAEAEAARAELAVQLATIEHQQRVIRDMSVPVLPLTETTLVMPLIGVLNHERLQIVQTQALSALTQSGAHYLILDVTGVPLIDTQVARGMIQVIKGARLLGAEVVLVGIRPEVAHAMVGVGIDFGTVVTRASLRHGIEYALHYREPARSTG